MANRSISWTWADDLVTFSAAFPEHLAFSEFPPYDAVIVILPAAVPVTFTEHSPLAERVQVEGENDTPPVPVFDHVTVSPVTEPK